MNYVLGVRLDEKPGPRSYLNKLPLLHFLGTCGEIAFEKPVTFFVGENGTGKSTLLEAIAVAMGFNPEGGSRDHMFTTKNTCSELCDLLTIIRTVSPKDGFFLRAESFYNTATYLEKNGSFIRNGGLLHARSHGEAFLTLIENRFEGHGLYILDEPEAALSPQSVMSLIPMIRHLVDHGSQFIIATHSPILMAYPGAEILQFSDGGVRPVPYRETEHYKMTKMFMDDPERMIHYLLESD